MQMRKLGKPKKMQKCYRAPGLVSVGLLQVVFFHFGKMSGLQLFPSRGKSRRFLNLSINFEGLQYCCQGSSESFLFVPELFFQTFSRLFCICSLFTYVHWMFSQLHCVTKSLGK